jgi:acetolactate synthase-1/2/3 large subunit
VTGNIAKFAPNALAAASEGRGGIVQFDIAPKNVNKVVMVTESVQGDCATNLSYLIPLIRRLKDRPEWYGRIQRWKLEYPLSACNNVPTAPPGLIRAQEVIQKLSDMTANIKHRTIITTGVGQHQMWAAQHYRWRYPRTMLSSGGLGTMGYGLPAAIGAKLARPECLVIDIDGDASFNMTISELLTAARNNIAIKVLLFNNEQMGMVSDLQRLYYNGRFTQNRQANPDFVEASRAFGVSAQRCSRPTDVIPKLKWLLETDEPAVLEVVTEQNSPVWPVVPAGRGLHEFLTYPKQALPSA